jgi:hypothetical protein
VGLSLALDRKKTVVAEAAGPAPKEASPDPGANPPAAPSAPAMSSPDPVKSRSALAVRAEELLSKQDPQGAVRAVLAADSKELHDAAVRAVAHRAAESLAASAENRADAEAASRRIDARRLFSALFACDQATSAECDQAFAACRVLNQSLVFGNGAPDQLVLRHKVQPGENLWALAKGPWRKQGASVMPGFVLHVNGISDARRLRVGHMLRVPLEPMRVLVRKSRFELAVLLGTTPVERFPVAVGADSSTPIGVFRVKDRLKNPDWYYQGRRIPFGDPQNIIGSRWIGLTGAPSAEGIGIHGTTDDASIGKAVSMGCVRMHDADVERVFEWIGEGTEVEIRD